MISISLATFFFSFQNISAKNFFNLNKIQIGFSRNVNTWCLLNSVFSNIVWILSPKNCNWNFSRNDKNVWCFLFQLSWALSFNFPPIRICICIIFKPQFNSNFWGQLHSSMIHRQLTQITQIQITHKQNSNFWREKEESVYNISTVTRLSAVWRSGRGSALHSRSPGFNPQPIPLWKVLDQTDNLTIRESSMCHRPNVSSWQFLSLANRSAICG